MTVLWIGLSLFGFTLTGAILAMLQVAGNDPYEEMKGDTNGESRK